MVGIVTGICAGRKKPGVAIASGDVMLGEDVAAPTAEVCEVVVAADAAAAGGNGLARLDWSVWTDATVDAPADCVLRSPVIAQWSGACVGTRVNSLERQISGAGVSDRPRVQVISCRSRNRNLYRRVRGRGLCWNPGTKSGTRRARRAQIRRPVIERSGVACLDAVGSERRATRIRDNEAQALKTRADSK